jgi:hypothetical protein
LEEEEEEEEEEDEEVELLLSPAESVVRKQTITNSLCYKIEINLNDHKRGGLRLVSFIGLLS